LTEETLVLTASRRAVIWAIATCVALIALGAWIMSQGDESGMFGESVLGVIVLAGLALFGVNRLVDPQRLILTKEGFTLTGVGGAVVPWRDVEAFFVHVVPGDDEGTSSPLPLAAWRLREGAAAGSSIAASLHRATGGLDGSLPTTLGREPEALVALMEDWRQRNAGA
jgi:hypothetical protein